MHNTRPSYPPRARPQLPEVKDLAARALLWAILLALLVNLAMTAYMFYVVEHTIETLRQIGNAFDQPTP